jgi:hemerythrin-like metal-binding protein
VKLINQLHNAMLAGKGRGEVNEVLTRLIAYTKSHFAAEENAMRKTSYPDLLQHTAEHQRLCATVDGFAQQVASGGTVTVELMNFLRDWLVNHIVKTDTLYSAHLAAHSVPA